MPIATLKAVAEDVLKTLFDRGEIWHWTIPNWKEVFGCEIASRSLIDNGLRISDLGAEVGKEQGLSRSLVFANGLRFSCKKEVQSTI
jgi:hypothetical protein